MCADRQEQKLARQIDGHCSSRIRGVAAGIRVNRQNNSTIPQPKILSPDAPLRHRDLCFRKPFVRPQVGRQLVVEPKQICIMPHMTNGVSATTGSCRWLGRRTSGAIDWI